MEKQKMQEEFEARFPVPAGVAWSDEHGNYGWLKKSAFQQAITYRALWTGWQASREAIVIELPVWEDWHDPGYGAGIDDCADAIKAAGLKVKP